MKEKEIFFDWVKYPWTKFSSQQRSLKEHHGLYLDGLDVKSQCLRCIVIGLNGDSLVITAVFGYPNFIFEIGIRIFEE